METNTYSEKDIQDYAAGIYGGNRADFEAYLELNPKASNQVKAYQNLYNLLRAEKSDSLSFNLADSVLEKIQQRESSKEPNQFQLLTILVIALTAVALMIIYPQFEFRFDYSEVFRSGIFILSGLMIVLLLVGFYLVEMDQIKRKLAL